MSTSFTSWSALGGGILIGLASLLLLVALGRIAGISGIAAGLLPPRRGDIGWRLAFVIGLPTGAALWMLGAGGAAVASHAPPWQLAHALARKTCSPCCSAGVDGARRGCPWAASQARKRAGGSAYTYIAMCECCSPQNSAHCPRYRPAACACSSTRFSRPGLMSILRFSSGTQNEWMTSAVSAMTFTRAPTGMWISFAVTAVVPG